MHPTLQILLGVTCVAILGFLVIDARSPREVVSVALEPSAAERAVESHCRIVRQADPTGFATPMGQRNPHCY